MTTPEMPTIAAKYVNGVVVVAGRFPQGGRWPVLLVNGARISINFPEAPLAPFEVAVKTYSECEGVLEALLEEGFVLPPHRFISSGHVVIPVCEMPPDVIPE